MFLAPGARFAAAAVVVLWTFATSALAQQIEVLWLGHSAFRITSATGKVIVIDPFLKKNPRTPAKYKDLSALGKVDLILVTHGHPDHISDLPELAKLTGAIVVSPFELGNNLVALGLVDAPKLIAMNKGGTVTPLGPAIKVHMVPAEHSSSVDMAVMKPESTMPGRYADGGQAVGYVIEFENGFRIYHTGDTDVFSDMALINRFYKPDLAMVCIGGHFTMDPEHAAFALREYIKPKQVIAMHYGTYPSINRTPDELKAALGNTPIKVLDMKPGDTLRF
jgi:L-ascorbate metabolism protein UlaG (beta-lactamase superfamily)